VVEMQFDGFVYPASIKSSRMARYRYRSRAAFDSMVIVFLCGGVKALESHSEANEAIYGHIPGLKVVVPPRRMTQGMMISHRGQ